MNLKEKNQIKVSIPLGNIDPLLLLGLADENLTVIAQAFAASLISVRGDRIRIVGPETEVRQAQELFQRLLRLAKSSEPVTPVIVQQEIAQLKGTQYPQMRKPEGKGQKVEYSEISVATPKKLIQPKTPNQANYLKAIDDYDIVICIGPAGTGKTYLAVAKAVSALVSGKVARIILTRPAVEAGESLGFLPGNLKEKVDPYLRPLYDALYDMVPVEKLRRLYDEEVVEVAPLAYMRGRTLSDAFVILDEAQNTTPIQMKMFLTRLGWNSKSIITGDITQIDLAKNQTSGLVEAQERLHHIDGIKFIYFDERDVVRPPLVSKIIKAYE
ncbi:MAG: PhoH family protein [candidate division WOR-3 bacterium]